MLNGLKKSQMKDDELFAQTIRRIDEEMLKDASDSLALEGSVYEMKNIAKLMDYSSAISHYATTGNLLFLEPMMKVELKKREPDAYFSFVNSAFLKNFTLTKSCCDYLHPTIAALNKSIEDPVLKVLKKQILTNLQRLPLDYKQEYSNDLCTVTVYHANEADFYLKGGNFMMALLHCYEGMLNVGRSIIRNCSGVKDPTASRIMEQTREKKGSERVDEIIEMHKKQKEKATSQMTRAVFGGRIWYAIANRRNAVFHNQTENQSQNQNYNENCDLADCDATREAVKKAVRALKGLARKFENGPEIQDPSA